MSHYNGTQWVGFWLLILIGVSVTCFLWWIAFCHVVRWNIRRRAAKFDRQCRRIFAWNERRVAQGYRRLPFNDALPYADREMTGRTRDANAEARYRGEQR